MRIRRLSVLVMAVAFSTTAIAPAFAHDSDGLTGLERARQAASVAIERAAAQVAGDSRPLPPGFAKKDSEGNNPDRPTGWDRAAASIADGLARGNGNGNGSGRGRSAAVLQSLLDGGRPAVLEVSASHGAKVSAMVTAHNELRRRERPPG